MNSFNTKDQEMKTKSWIWIYVTKMLMIMRISIDSRRNIKVAEKRNKSNKVHVKL